MMNISVLEQAEANAKAWRDFEWNKRSWDKVDEELKRGREPELIDERLIKEARYAQDMAPALGVDLAKEDYNRRMTRFYDFVEAGDASPSEVPEAEVKFDDVCRRAGAYKKWEQLPREERDRHVVDSMVTFEYGQEYTGSVLKRDALYRKYGAKNDGELADMCREHVKQRRENGAVWDQARQCLVDGVARTGSFEEALGQIQDPKQREAAREMGVAMGEAFYLTRAHDLLKPVMDQLGRKYQKEAEYPGSTPILDKGDWLKTGGAQDRVTDLLYAHKDEPELFRALYDLTQAMMPEDKRYWFQQFSTDMATSSKGAAEVALGKDDVYVAMRRAVLDAQRSRRDVPESWLGRGIRSTFDQAAMMAPVIATGAAVSAATGGNLVAGTLAGATVGGAVYGSGSIMDAYADGGSRGASIGYGLGVGAIQGGGDVLTAGLLGAIGKVAKTGVGAVAREGVEGFGRSVVGMAGRRVAGAMMGDTAGSMAGYYARRMLWGGVKGVAVEHVQENAEDMTTVLLENVMRGAGAELPEQQTFGQVWEQNSLKNAEYGLPILLLGGGMGLVGGLRQAWHMTRTTRCAPMLEAQGVPRAIAHTIAVMPDGPGRDSLIREQVQGGVLDPGKVPDALPAAYALTADNIDFLRATAHVTDFKDHGDGTFSYTDGEGGQAHTLPVEMFPALMESLIRSEEGGAILTAQIQAMGKKVAESEGFRFESADQEALNRYMQVDSEVMRSRTLAYIAADAELAERVRNGEVTVEDVMKGLEVVGVTQDNVIRVAEGKAHIFDVAEELAHARVLYDLKVGKVERGFIVQGLRDWEAFSGEELGDLNDDTIMHESVARLAVSALTHPEQLGKLPPRMRGFIVWLRSILAEVGRIFQTGNKLRAGVESGAISQEFFEQLKEWGGFETRRTERAVMEEVTGESFGEHLASVRRNNDLQGEKNGIEYQGDEGRSFAERDLRGGSSQGYFEVHQDAGSSGRGDFGAGEGSQSGGVAIDSAANDGGSNEREEGYGLRPDSSSALGGLGVREYSPAPHVLDLAQAKGFYTGAIVEIEASPAGAARFRECIEAGKASQAPYGECVYTYDAAEYEGMRLFLLPNGKAGFALKDGDMVSVFSDRNPGVEGKVANAIVALAVQLGATKCDCYGTILPGLYARFGFRAVARDQFNGEFAPESMQEPGHMERYYSLWGGKPDVVYMVYEGNRDRVIEEYDGGAQSEYASLPYTGFDECLQIQADAVAATRRGKEGDGLFAVRRKPEENEIQVKNKGILRFDDGVIRDEDALVLRTDGADTWGDFPNDVFFEERGYPSLPVKMLVGSLKYGYLHLLFRHGQEIHAMMKGESMADSIEMFADYVLKHIEKVGTIPDVATESKYKNKAFLLGRNDRQENMLVILNLQKERGMYSFNTMYPTKGDYGNLPDMKDVEGDVVALTVPVPLSDATSGLHTNTVDLSLNRGLADNRTSPKVDGIHADDPVNINDITFEPEKGRGTGFVAGEDALYSIRRKRFSEGRDGGDTSPISKTFRSMLQAAVDGNPVGVYAAMIGALEKLDRTGKGSKASINRKKDVVLTLDRALREMGRRGIRQGHGNAIMGAKDNVALGVALDAAIADLRTATNEAYAEAEAERLEDGIAKEWEGYVSEERRKAREEAKAAVELRRKQEGWESKQTRRERKMYVETWGDLLRKKEEDALADERKARREAEEDLAKDVKGLQSLGKRFLAGRKQRSRTADADARRMGIYAQAMMRMSPDEVAAVTERLQQQYDALNEAGGEQPGGQMEDVRVAMAMAERFGAVLYREKMENGRFRYVCAPEQIKAAKVALNEIYQDGKARWAEVERERVAKQRGMIGGVHESAGGDLSAEGKDEARKGIEQEGKKAGVFKAIGHFLMSPIQYAEALIAKSSGGAKGLMTEIRDELAGSGTRTALANMAMKERMAGVLKDAAVMATGKEGWRSVANYMTRLTEEKVLWNGSETYTRGELIDIYMTSREGDGVEALMRSHGFTAEALDGLPEAIGTDGVFIANELGKWYQDMGGEVRVAYEATYGHPFWTSQNYVPREREHDVREMDVASGVKTSAIGRPSNLLERTSSTAQLRFAQNPFVKATRYGVTMNSWMQHARLIDMYNGVLRRADVNLDLKRIFGESDVDALMGGLRDVLNDGYMQGQDQELMHRFGQVMSIMARASLGWNLGPIVKNLAAFVNPLLGTDFSTKEVGRAMASLEEGYGKVSPSDVLGLEAARARFRAGLKEETLYEMAGKANWKALSQFVYWDNVGMSFMDRVDLYVTLKGAMIAARVLEMRGMAKGAILEEVNLSLLRSSQPNSAETKPMGLNASRRSAVVLSNFMFMSDMMNKAGLSAMLYAQGRGWKGSGVILGYAFASAVLNVVVSKLFGRDDDDADITDPKTIAASILLAPFLDVPIAGDIATYLSSKAGVPTYASGRRVVDVSAAVNSLQKVITMEAADKTYPTHERLDAWIRAAKGVTQGVGSVFAVANRLERTREALALAAASTNVARTGSRFVHKVNVWSGNLGEVELARRLYDDARRGAQKAEDEYGKESAQARYERGKARLLKRQVDALQGS